MVLRLGFFVQAASSQRPRQASRQHGCSVFLPLPAGHSVAIGRAQVGPTTRRPNVTERSASKAASLKPSPKWTGCMRWRLNTEFRFRSGLYDDVESRQVAVWRKWCEHKCRRFYNHFPTLFEYKREHPDFLRELFIRGDVHYNPFGNEVIARDLIAQYP